MHLLFSQNFQSTKKLPSVMLDVDIELYLSILVSSLYLYYASFSPSTKPQHINYIRATISSLVIANLNQVFMLIAISSSIMLTIIRIQTKILISNQKGISPSKLGQVKEMMFVFFQPINYYWYFIQSPYLKYLYEIIIYSLEIQNKYKQYFFQLSSRNPIHLHLLFTVIIIIMLMLILTMIIKVIFEEGYQLARIKIIIIIKLRYFIKMLSRVTVLLYFIILLMLMLEYHLVLFNQIINIYFSQYPYFKK